MDRDIASGTAYSYRLQIMMLDGTRVYSEVLPVVSAGILAAAIHAVTPNPASGLLRVKYTITRSGSAQVSVARLQGGMYFIRLSTADRTLVHEVVFVE